VNSYTTHLELGGYVNHPHLCLPPVYDDSAVVPLLGHTVVAVVVVVAGNGTVQVGGKADAIEAHLRERALHLAGSIPLVLQTGERMH